MFLQPHCKVIPTESHDYPEWHKGRRHFSLWYLEITDSTVLAYLEQLRQDFSAYLYQPNCRQFHITLYICGFYMTDLHPLVRFDDDFHVQQCQQQVQQLLQQQLTEFELKITKLNSFDSALFVEVVDAQKMLVKIRDCLAPFQVEIAALDYCPHITLGLYRDHFSSNEILAKIKHYPSKEHRLQVQHLSFGYYQAQHLQGPLQVIQQVDLSAE